MSNTPIETYLFFGGRCEEALEFYRSTLGAEVEMMMRFKDCPAPIPAGAIPPGFENKIMHASFRVGGARLMASDGNEVGPRFGGFSLSLGLPTAADADRVFAALALGGKVEMPLAQTFWSPRFGTLTDRFGIGWMVSVVAGQT